MVRYSRRAAGECQKWREPEARSPSIVAGRIAGQSLSQASINVVAGALFDSAGRVLIAQRPAGKALAGRWEFPGGKLNDGEAPYAGLVRELREELGVEVGAAEQLMRYAHEYADRTVWLDMWIVGAWSGEPLGLDGQALRWVEPARLAAEDILEADQPIVAVLAQRFSAAAPDRRPDRPAPPGSPRRE